jgi:hypothetical protein
MVAKMALEHSEIQALKAEIFAEADERYVHIDSCTEKQEAVNKKFANDDKRIEIISHDFGVIKKLMWAVASASIGSLATAIFELILK